MPSFNFKVVPKKQQRTYKKLNTIHKVVVKNVEGVVFIDLNAVYSVHVNDELYLIHPDNYTCKNKDTVFYQGYMKDNHRVCYKRLKENNRELDNKLYLPFMAGSVVKGDIVRNLDGNCYYFDIHKVYKDNSNELSKQALKFYRENIEIINNKLKEMYESRTCK